MNALWKQMKSSRSQTPGPVDVSQSQAYGSPLTKLLWKQMKSKMSSAPELVDLQTS